MNPFSIAAKGKGFIGTVTRMNAIGSRYGVSSRKMDRQLTHFVGILNQFDCGATFPITVSALVRRKGFIHKYLDENVEFAVHGYKHIDHTKRSPDELFAFLDKAKHILKENGVACGGFRCPYLRWNEDTLTIVRQVGFQYDSSQGLAWDVLDDDIKTPGYERVIEFYGAVSASDYPALPRFDNDLLRIPYSLPDDEALIERFRLKAAEPMNRLWLAMLEKSHRLGELFTLGLHPERIDHCETPLVVTLRRARELSPPVWIARLDEIASWWKARTETLVSIIETNNGEYEMNVNGPKGVTVLFRGVEVMNQAEKWDTRYHCSSSTRVRFRAVRRPFIGVSPSSDPYLARFLRQQGYIVELAEDSQKYVYYLDRSHFGYEAERPLLDQIEQGNFPLVRLNRWPNGSRSALSVTGDIDALTIWDYGLRFLGR
jgi:hypothetical protein